MKNQPILKVSVFASIIIPFLVFIVSCKSKDTSRDMQRILKATCNVCKLESFLVEPASNDIVAQISFAKPIAIHFYNQMKFLDKYDNEKGTDTIIKVLGLKGSGDRNKIYSLVDQYFYFVKEMKPVLFKMSVPIDTLSDISTIRFTGPTDSFIVNIDKYKSLDGVLMFTPGKRPVFWTLEREKRFCLQGFGILNQYFGCPANTSNPE